MQVCCSLEKRTHGREHAVDEGHGGQVLLTQAAWMQLYPVICLCKFPTVYHLGLYRKTGSEHTSELHLIYSITEWLGTGIVRNPVNLRKFEQVIILSRHALSLFLSHSFA